jgi:RNA polymerase sigma factor (sigma-70 family)
MMTTETVTPVECSDVELVTDSLRGSREAFAHIVARYQTLICSLAYSATGSLTQSEDLAQETFVAAWRQLSDLREPAKLRSWLCGIARNLSHRIRRGQEREPVHGAEPLDSMTELPALEPHPLDQVIGREEEAILWRSLERIPETYREPLILFYREHQSMTQVAQVLDLSEEAVRQRLVRGRKLLQEQVREFVEGALEKTAPGRNFTMSVLAALPMEAVSAKTVTAGATLAKAGATAKSAATLGSLGGVFAVLGGACVTWLAQADDTKSPRERQFFLQMVGFRLLVTLLTLVAYYFFQWKLDSSSSLFAREILISAFVFSCFIAGMVFFVFSSQRQRQIQIEEKTFNEAEWKLSRREIDSAANSPAAKSGAFVKGVRFMAFALVMSAIMVFSLPWKQQLGKAVLGSVTWVLVLYLSYRGWQNRPRYQSLRSGWVVASPIFFGLITLWAFNLKQHQAHAGSVISSAASPAAAMVFNVVVILAYALCAGILVWKRKSEFPSSH